LPEALLLRVYALWPTISPERKVMVPTMRMPAALVPLTLVPPMVRPSSSGLQVTMYSHTVSAPALEFMVTLS
jgi:hypothetical protein